MTVNHGAHVRSVPQILDIEKAGMDADPSRLCDALDPAMKDAATKFNHPRPNTGIFASEDEALHGLVRRLAETLDPQAIWLFGSRARGDHRPDSDFDFMVVAKPGASWGSDDYEMVYKPAKGTLVGCDIVPCAKSDFDEAATLHTSFVAIVMDEGQKLYEARA